MALVLVLLHLWTDHVMLHQIINAINQHATQTIPQTPPQPEPR